MNSEEVELIISSFEDDLKKAIEHESNEFSIIRAGRANPHILDKVTIEYYGVPTPLNQMANIAVPEARMITISVWDISQIKAVSKAIVDANLGVTPSDDGRVIRLIFPSLTEERRRELTKQVRKICEDTKVAMRNARRDALDMIKNLKKNGEISEDEMASIEKDIQKIMDNFNVKADSLSLEKEKEVMEV